MEVIPNGVFLAEIDGALASAGPTRDRRAAVRLFLSRVHYKKGLDYLADSFAELRAKNPDWQLVVAGPDGGERQPLEQRVVRLHLNGSVRVVGPVYGAEKFALLRSPRASVCRAARKASAWQSSKRWRAACRWW
jgi:glycosyltransferase involved in cell wall biosynthesis